MKRIIFGIIILFSLLACEKSERVSDAYGNFECEEVIVSSEVMGLLTSFDLSEGEWIRDKELVAIIDTTDKQLLIDELHIQEEILNIKYKKAQADQALISLDLDKAKLDTKRYQTLFSQNAIAKDVLENFQHKQSLLYQQYSSSNLAISQIKKEISQVQIKIEEAKRQLNKCYIKSPNSGRLLAKYVQAGELLTVGKAIFKLANLSDTYLKAYISQSQLSEIALEDQVNILYDSTSGSKQIEGRIAYISSQAEFTPKTIQTKEERANLVYAIKITLEYDDSIKIGMPAEVIFKRK